MNFRTNSILNFKFILSFLGIRLKEKRNSVFGAETTNVGHRNFKPTSLYHFEGGDIASVIDEVEVCVERKICILRFKVAFDGKKIRSFETKQGNIIAFSFDEFLVDKNSKCERPGNAARNHYRCAAFPISDPRKNDSNKTEDSEDGFHSLLNVEVRND